MEYLKDNSYYVDLYDLRTIEECLDYYWALKDGFAKDRSKFEKFSDEEFKKETHKATSYAVNIIIIQRYRYKAQTIKEWMDRDRQLQEKFDNATSPKGIYCKECFSRTKIMSKDLMSSDEKVLFMYECMECHKRQALYEDGTEWYYEPPGCPKCDSPLKSESKDKNEVSTTIYSCTKCSYMKKDVFDFKKSREERIKREERDRKLLAEYREEFCLDDKKGPEAVMNLDNIVRFAKEMEEKEKKEKDPIFQKTKQLKRLKIGQLKELLEATIGKEGYQDLAFAKPDMGQHVIVNFSVNDMEERKEYDSVKKLQKLIKASLQDTNWRLMSDGIEYRLGILTGRLKAYEQEEDLMSLVQSPSNL